jgi:hypothetical protein
MFDLLPNFEPFGFGSITFFQIQEPLHLIFEPSSVPYTHYTFPNAKDYASTKF